MPWAPGELTPHLHHVALAAIVVVNPDDDTYAGLAALRMRPGNDVVYRKHTNYPICMTNTREGSIKLYLECNFKSQATQHHHNHCDHETAKRRPGGVKEDTGCRSHRGHASTLL